MQLSFNREHLTLNRLRHHLLLFSAFLKCKNASNESRSLRANAHLPARETHFVIELACVGLLVELVGLRHWQSTVLQGARPAQFHLLVVDVAVCGEHTLLESSLGHELVRCCVCCAWVRQRSVSGRALDSYFRCDYEVLGAAGGSETYAG